VKLLYFVHDLNDPTVARRIRFLQAGNVTVTVIGFRRGMRRADGLKDVTSIELGRTRDSRLVARIGSVFLACFRLWRFKDHLRQADVLMARQLEMLMIACVVRICYRSTKSVVFECLDIHRLMVRRDLVGETLRVIERSLLRMTSLLVVSSPGFVDNYFQTYHAKLPQTYLLENKLLDSELPLLNAGDTDRTADAAATPPWKIGWYGVIRCLTSLEALAALVRDHPGLVEVTIAGKISENLREVFDTIINAAPGISYIGPYDRARDLKRLYEGVHFAWAVDYYEAGGNSEWLLPNRLYEGGYYRTAMIASAKSQTGNWLARHDAGFLLGDPLSAALIEFFRTLDVARFEMVRGRMSALPDALFAYGLTECTAFADRLKVLMPSRRATLLAPSLIK
jgi:succinoglycan biosynthesis protein ExoL